jgi:hypothetical protein
MPRSISSLALSLSLLVPMLTACGLTVTQDRPSFEQLDPHEQSVVQKVLAELRGFNKQVEARTTLSIASVIDKEKINVSFEGHIFSANLGDGVIHVAPWENLSDGQRKLVQSWFASPSLASAKSSYEKLFYRFLAVSQGGKQYMYEALTVQWVFSNRSIFNVERDTIREALSYYRTIGQQASMWNFLTSICKPLLTKYRGKIPFDKKYLNANFQSLADLEAPTGYMYYICEWIDMGKTDAVDLTTELLWVQDIPALAGSSSSGTTSR